VIASKSVLLKYLDSVEFAWLTDSGFFKPKMTLLKYNFLMLLESFVWLVAV